MELFDCNYDVCMDGICYRFDIVSKEAYAAVVHGDSNGIACVPESITIKGDEFRVTRIEAVGDKGLKSLAIPDSVKSFGELAFNGCTELGQFIYRGSLIEVESYAFYQCKSLPVENDCIYAGSCLVGASKRDIRAVEIKSGTTFINNYAFNGCVGLSSVHIPDSVTGVGFGSFANCDSLPVEGNLRYADTCVVGATKSPHDDLHEAVIREGTRLIGSFTFRDCQELKSVAIPESVVFIGIGAFENCINLESVELPDSLKTISEGAFEDCMNLKELSIPESVAYIGAYAFAKSGLNAITIPDTMTEIPRYAFANCIDLVQVIIPDTVKCIREGAFYGCSALTGIDIPESVELIEDRAFAGCFRLKSVSIPDCCVHIGDTVFASCPSLPADDGLQYVNTPLGLYIVGTLSKDITEAVIKSGTKVIDERAFCLCDRLQKVIIPETVTRICKGAFFGCSSLTTIIIPDSVEYIDEQAFLKCTSLHNVPSRKENPSS